MKRACSAFRTPQRYYLAVLMFAGGVCAATPSHMKLSASASDIEAFLGTKNAKLVFVDRYEKSGGALCYIEFSSAVDTPVVHVMSSPQNAKVPVISPDGDWVVYVDVEGTGGEAGSAVTTVSSSYIAAIEEGAAPVLVAADNAFEPRFSPDTASLKVVYCTKAPNYAWETDAKTMIVSIDVSGAQPVVGSAAVLTEGGYTGGISWDEKYVCGGGGNAALYNLDAGGEPDTISLWPQSCNASISPSRLRPDALMCLSFGGEGIPEIKDGGKWGQWQIIHIVRPRNAQRDEILRYYDRPVPTALKFPLHNTETCLFTGGTKWHHPEWSNHPCFAVATVNVERAWVENPDGYKKPEGVGEVYKTGAELQEKVCVVNLRTGKYLEVLRLDDAAMNWAGVDTFYQLFWPWLWVEIGADFQETAGWLTMEYQDSLPIPYSIPAVSHIPGVGAQSVFFDGHAVSSGAALSRIGLNNVLGREIAAYVPQNSATKTVVVGDVFGRRAGVYFLRVETARGAARTFRWVVTGK